MAKSQRTELRLPLLGQPQPPEVSPKGDKLDWDAIEGMAKDIFVKLVSMPSSIQRTPESLVELAFEKATVFWCMADVKRMIVEDR